MQITAGQNLCETRVYPQGPENLHQQALYLHTFTAESLLISDQHSNWPRRPKNAKPK